MASINNYPFKFDNTIIPFWPSKWGRNNNPIRETMQSEGGRDMMQIIRAEKISVPFNCSVADDEWAGFFETYSKKESFVVSIYSPVTHGYEVHTMYMNGFSCNPRKGSEKLTEVAGVWEISFTLEEL